MSIRLKISLLFTVLVSSFLIISFLSISKWLESKNISQFQQRLKDRTSAIVRLWEISDTLIQNVMSNLDTTSLASFRNKYVAIYDGNKKIRYRFYENPTDTTTPPPVSFNKAGETGETFFTEGFRDGYLLSYTDRNQKYYAFIIARDEYRENVSNNLKAVLWIVATAGILLSFFAGWFFSGFILRPIKRIVGEVTLFSTSDLSNRISAGNTKDELNALAKTFNDLLDRLEDSFLIQRRFISNASHELSTPLTSMSSQLEIGLLQKRSSEDYEKIMRSVSEEVHVMSELTKSLLEIARTGNEGAIELSDVRIDEVVMKAVANVKKSYPETVLIVHFADLPEDENECIIPGNSDLVYSVFKNIIAHGCKYSKDKKINVNLNFTDKKIILDFANNSDILTEDELEKIFQPFFRGSSASGKPGFGLGLSLTRRILKLHNGTLSVSSHPAQGTHFHIELFSKAAANQF